MFSKKNRLLELFGWVPFTTQFFKILYNGYLILTFHSVSDVNLDYYCNIKTKLFEKSLIFFKKNFKIISLEDILLEISKKKSPENIEIAVTFDDGYLNNYKEAFPILKKLEIPATFFINVDFIEKGYKDKKFMDWIQVEEISSNKLFTIGSHSLSHKKLSKLSDNDIYYYLTKSKEIIEKKLNKKVKFISYPFGDFNPKVLDIACKSGYILGFTIKKKINNYKINRYEMGRFGINPNFIVKRFY